MSERKVKCARCGKWFKAPDYKHTLCPSCASAERAKRNAAPPPASAVRAGLDGRAGVASAPAAVALPPVSAPVAAPAAPSAQAPPIGQAARPVSTIEAPSKATARRPAELTEAQRQAVERRYLELAAPNEFDGIRGQIAAELRLPKGLVKQAINDLRLRLGRPSWWDLRQHVVTPEIYAAVKARYVPLLESGALPPVGVHRQIAGDLGVSTLQAYRAIGQIRADLGLPRFTPRPDAAAEPEQAHAS